MHRHVISAHKARVDVSIRQSAHAKYSRIKPPADSIVSGVVPVIIEVPRGQRNKLEFDKETGTLQLDRVLHSSCFYPGDYGFVPQTLCNDGDPIDVLVLSKFPLMAGCVAECRLVGVMDMEDEKGGDAKLIAVVHNEPRSSSVRDIQHVPQHVKAEIQQFFELYKKLESKGDDKKWVKILSWGNREEALQQLKDSINLHAKKMSEELVVAAIDEEIKKPPVVGSVYDLTKEMMKTPPGEAICTAYIEVQKGDANKYEWDHSTGYLTLDRVLHSSVFYPGDYGFIPQTLCGDGDPLDVLILSSFPLAPGSLSDVRVVGALNMSDEKGEDQKLLTVVVSDPRWDEVQDLSDVEEHLKREIAQFFETYKELENVPGSCPPTPLLGSELAVRPKKKAKFAEVTGWMDRKAALALLRKTEKAFQASPDGIGTFPKLLRLHIGDKTPWLVNVIVKAPKNTAIKHDVCGTTGLMKITKVLHSAVEYPGDYGSLPQTLGEDGKSIECLILSVFPLPLGCVVEVRPIALLDMEDQNGPNSKVIGVPHTEPRLGEYLDLDNIPDHVKLEVSEFFNTYRNLEGKESWARVTGWRDRAAAHGRIDECRKRFFAFGMRMEDMEEKIFTQEERIKRLEDALLKKK